MANKAGTPECEILRGLRDRTEERVLLSEALMSKSSYQDVVVCSTSDHNKHAFRWIVGV